MAIEEERKLVMAISLATEEEMAITEARELGMAIKLAIEEELAIRDARELGMAIGVESKVALEMELANELRMANGVGYKPSHDRAQQLGVAEWQQKRNSDIRRSPVARKTLKSQRNRKVTRSR